MAQITSHIGYHEGPDNATPFGVWYGSGFGNSPWCDEYVSYCAAAAGGSDIVGKFAYTVAHAQWFKDRGQWGLEPRRGAIAFFDWSGGSSISGIDHVGTVESVDANGQPVTIDGNYSDEVARWRHPIRVIVGYGYPAYANVEAWLPTAPVPTPLPAAAWDGHTFPGSGFFALGSNHPAVTVLGQMLVSAGFGAAYKSGPGIPMGPADVTNCAAFERSQGWSGADADGYPGPATWAALWAKAHAARPTAPAPAPAPHPAPAPASHVPPTQGYQGGVYLGKLVRGQTDSDSVRVLQRALRAYPGISTIPLNPSGVTGTYGSETEAMCRKVYQTFDAWQPGAGWGSGDLGVPGRALLAKLGCTVVG